MSQEKIERNWAIYNDYTTGGFTMRELTIKYKLSDTFIYLLIQRYKDKAEEVNNK